MNRQPFFNGLQFQKNLVSHDEVYLVAAIQLKTFVEYRKIHLAFEVKSFEVQFMA